VTFEELPLADGSTSSKQERAQLGQLARKYQIRTWYLWSGAVGKFIGLTFGGVLP
jgi:hypothetical protein